MAARPVIGHVSSLVPRNANAVSALLVIVAIVNSATMGYDSTMMNGLGILPQYTEYFNLNTATTGLNNAALWMGGIFGALLIHPVSDYLGRRPAILIAGVTCIVGAVITAAAPNIAGFVVGRLVVGTGAQLASGPAATLIAEVLPPRQRGAVLGLFYTCFFVGSLFSAGINLHMVTIPDTWAWRAPAALQSMFSVLALLVLPFVPESPRWLVDKGRHDQARDVLSIMYGNNQVDAKETVDVFDEIVAVLDRERRDHPQSPYKEFFKTKANRHRLFIVVSFGVMVEMFGNFVISYYLGDMLTQAGIVNPTTQLQVNVILNCWSFAVAVTGSLLTDVIGRRPATLCSIAGMTVSLYLFGGLSKVYGTSDNTSAVYGTIALIFVFQGCYAFAITPMSSLYIPEIMPYKLRNAGVGILKLITSMFGLMASFSMSYAMADLGWKFYLINASWNIIFFFVVYFWWVETRRMPLEEIALQFGDLDMAEIHARSADSPAEPEVVDMSYNATEKSK